MKILIGISIVIISMVIGHSQNFYDFTMESIDGEPVSLNQYKGKVVLVVNVASKCGYTPQYDGLQELYETYEKDGFVILGFPANNFKGQEPGSNEEIKEFCRLEYGVEFPLFSKVSVRGDDQDALFSFLTSQPNSDFTGDIEWNFEKFLIDKEGKLQRRFRSKVEPLSDELVAAIKTELNK